MHTTLCFTDVSVDAFDGKDATDAASDYTSGEDSYVHSEDYDVDDGKADETAPPVAAGTFESRQDDMSAGVTKHASLCFDNLFLLHYMLWLRRQAPQALIGQ